MAIETLDDVLEEVADQVGVYDVCTNRCFLGWEICRSCYVADLKQRIKKAVMVELILNEYKGTGEP